MSAPDTTMPTEMGQPGLSEIQRITKVFYEPSATFADIKRNASWWMPFLLVTVFAWLFVFAVGKQVGWEQIVENQFTKMTDAQKSRIEQLPPDTQAKQRQGMLMGFKYGSWASPVFILAFFAILGLIYWGIFSFGMGKSVTFKQSFAVIIYSAVPSVIKTLLAVMLLFMGADAAGFDMENPVAASNLGILVDRASHPALSAFLTRMDIFTIWATLLTGIGLSVISGVKRQTSIIISFVVLFVLSAIPALIALIRS
jgi:hypothetical protein